MELKVAKRSLTWKKVKSLRKKGILPGIVYWRHVKDAYMIQFDKNDFLKLYKKAWETQTVILEGDWIKEMVLIHDIDVHPVTDEVIHVDFLAVKADEKVEAEVPVVLVGESPVEKNNLWRLELLKDTILVEAYPQDLPEKIEIDVSGIEKLSDVIHVKDIKVSDKIEIKEDLEDTIVTVLSLEELSAEQEETETWETTESEETSSDQANS